MPARDLPRAERLSRLLYEQAQRVTEQYQLDAEDDVVEDYFTIERVEPGALWLTGDRLGQRRDDGEFARSPGMVGVPRPVALTSRLAGARGRERVPVEPPQASAR